MRSISCTVLVLANVLTPTPRSKPSMLSNIVVKPFEILFMWLLQSGSAFQSPISTPRSMALLKMNCLFYHAFGLDSQKKNLVCYWMKLPSFASSGSNRKRSPSPCNASVKTPVIPINAIVHQSASVSQGDETYLVKPVRLLSFIAWGLTGIPTQTRRKESLLLTP